MTIYLRHPNDNEEVSGPFEDVPEAEQYLRDQRLAINLAEYIYDPEEEEELELIRERDGINLMYDSEPELYLAYAGAKGEDITDLGNWAGDCEEAYYGTYSSDAEFAEEVADGMGESGNGEWPYMHINWDDAAYDLLQGDYFNQDGYYFRNN